MGDLRERIATLSAEKRALLERRLLRRNPNPAGEPSILPRSATEPGCLSFAQERLWFLHQFESEIALYNDAALRRVTGPIRRDLLERSLNEIVRRHEALRSCFPTVGGRPTLVVQPPAPLPLSFVDLEPLPAPQRETEAWRRIHEVGQQPFDLDRGPLIRALLLRLSQGEHLLLLVAHHIVIDGWSWTVLFRELGALYEAFAAGRPSPLAELPIQYADYAAWQRRHLQGEELERHLAYWQERLAGAPAMLELSTDRPRPAQQSFRGARHPLAIPPFLAAALKGLSRREGVTLFSTLLAAFKTLLHRYTHQTDILVGTPVANRSRVEVEGLIGCFVNTLVLRTNLGGDPTFRELLRRVHEGALEAFAHAQAPFEKVVEAIQPERNLSHTPLFQVMLILQSASEPTSKFSELVLRRIGADIGVAKFDLTLDLAETPDGGVEGWLEYASDLFDPTTIARMEGHLRTLLEGIVANPDRPLSQLPLLTDWEKRQLLVEWNDTGYDFPRHACLHELFEAQVVHSPETTAVVFEEKALTYAELNARANRLAHALRARGVGPGTRVGICVERSLEMVVGLLGILKAGAAYVPLDPAYPAERLSFMLGDADVPVLLTQQRLVGALPRSRASILCLDTDWPAIAEAAAHNPISGATPEDLAYVIYTSGSTGRPKGVQIPHRAVVNFLHSMRRKPGLSREDTLLAVTTLSFDIAALELFLPLIVGARVVLVSREVASDGVELAEALARHGATVMQATPVTWRMLIESGWQGDGKLKMLCGGEALSPELATQLLERGGTLWNLYGPTETTIWSTLCEVARGEGPVLIGRPIANTRVYALDSHRCPVPVGVAGELYIGGEGLGRGYLNRPELTAERFVPDPFSSEPEARLYRTGDLVRFRPDGNLEFLGRLDHQVKIRGFRIELGEIEAALDRHPQVRQAIVLAREDQPGQKRLVAYVVPEAGALLAIGDLRTYLKERLPEYMVPSAFVVMEALPLTPNGKVNRTALPPPGTDRPELTETFVPPGTPEETTLASIWREVLGLDRVGVHDNFFDLGGDSILTIQIIARASQVGLRFSPKQLFQYQTIAELAATARATATPANGNDSTPPRTAPADGLPEVIDVELSQEQLESILAQVSPGWPEEVSE